MFDTEELFLRALRGRYRESGRLPVLRARGMKQLIGLNRPAAIEKNSAAVSELPESGEACLQHLSRMDGRLHSGKRCAGQAGTAGGCLHG